MNTSTAPQHRLPSTLPLAARQVLPMLQDFAAQRVERGIKDGYETVVRNAMLWALEQRLAESFTQDVRTAWNETYSLLTGIIGRDASASLVGEFVD